MITKLNQEKTQKMQNIQNKNRLEINMHHFHGAMQYCTCHFQ